MIQNNQIQNQILTPNLQSGFYEEQRKVFDNIHGFIRFEKRVWHFVDTQEFQKLRFIKQLGCLNYVFPGATHTRFQHCLGTGHLAKTFIQLLIKNNRQRYKGVNIKSAIYTVTLAGIMHDIGHGPFSHTFDGEVVDTYILDKGMTNADINKLSQDEKKERKWKHQHGSQILFRHIVKKYKLIDKYITKQQVERVVKLIHGHADKQQRQWQFQLISNKLTGIDVDKLDYFRRDAFYLGAKGVLIDHQLLMNQARIILYEGQQQQKKRQKKYTIAYPSKYALQVNDIFYSRYKLYKTYYLNNISKGIQFMIMDVLKLVQPIFQFNKICQNIKLEDKWIDKYVSLTDGILQRIEFIDENEKKYENFNKQDIIDAKKILKRIKHRNIYRFVREVQTSITLDILNKYKQVLKDAFDAQNIKQYIFRKTNISKEEFHVAVTQAGYGLKDINPLNKVKFFRKQNFPNQIRQYKCLTQAQFRAQNISILYTKAFAQRFAKLYVKDIKDKDKVNRINEGFYKYFQQKKKECQLAFHHINMGRTHFYMRQQQDLIHYNPNVLEVVGNEARNNLPDPQEQ